MCSIAAQFVFLRDGCPLHYWLSGPVDRPWLVFTHGVMMDHRIFADQVRFFSSSYRVLTWDVRGHGRSRPTGGGFSLRRTAADLLAILDEVQCPQAVLVGHSMGGYISQEAAFLAPRRIRALALVGSTNLTGELPGSFRVGKRIIPWVFRLTPDTVVRLMTGYAAGVRPRTQKVARAVSRVITRQDRIEFWTAIMHGFHFEPDYRFDHPLLLTYGRWDLVGLGQIPRQMRKWARRLPAGSCRVIPGAGHNAHQDTPALFNRILSEFLENIDFTTDKEEN